MLFQITRAPAKLNLFLTVTGRRADSYHLLDSLFVFVGLCDKLVIASSQTLSLKVEGPFADGLALPSDNLVLRAATMLRSEAGVTAGADIRLEKIIPVEAGLGGGSADAAASLRQLNQFWDLNWPLERLMPLAAKLGADVPACLLGQPVIAGGIGDLLKKAPALPRFSVLLVNPRVPTATPDVFKAFARMNPVIEAKALLPLPKAWSDLASLAASLEQRGNDLLPAALSVTPVISDVLAVLKALPDAAYVGLSGSGATCFALFATDAEARKAGEQVLKGNPDWWAWW